MQPRVHQARTVRNLRSVHGCSRPTSRGEMSVSRSSFSFLPILVSRSFYALAFPVRSFVDSLVRCRGIRPRNRRRTTTTRRRRRRQRRTRPRGTSKGELRTYSVKNVNKPWRWRRCTDTGQFFCERVPMPSESP